MGFSSYRYENWGSRTCPPKYTVSGRDQIHERPGPPDTKFHVLYTILLSWKSQDKDSNNSLTFSSSALWKHSRNTLKLNCINYVDWLRSKTPLPIVRVQLMAFWRIYTHPCPFATTPLLQPIQLHFSEASCPVTEQDSIPENSFSKELSEHLIPGHHRKRGNSSWSQQEKKIDWMWDTNFPTVTGTKCQQ